MLGITDYLWRLLPGNPILLRVVEAAGKRKRDLFIRCGYLGLLVFIVVISLLSSGDQAGQSLSKLAATSASLFQRLSYLQLALVALLSPIFTAGAITQEKDSQTYDILLATPLTNGQIVLGSLISRVFFVVALLISGVPVFSITQVFGGVAIRSIWMSFLIAAATAFVTGALAMAIAVFKVGTRRTIFSFYLFIVIYLGGIYLLDQLDYFHPFIDAKDATHRGTSWLTGIHPFLALKSVFNDKTYLPPQYGDLPDHWKTWPIGYYLSNPAGFYVSFMFLLSFALIMPSIILLRNLAQSSGTLKTWVLQKLKISKGDRTRKPRGVWTNPIAWREAKTKASAARASVLRYGFIGGGAIGAVVLCVLHFTIIPPAQYITIDSYSAGAGAGSGTLTVYYNDGKPPTVYNIHDATPAQIERPKGENDDVTTPRYDAFNLDAVQGNLEVVTITTSATQIGKRAYVNTLQLRAIRRKLETADVRQWLLGAVILEFSVILLIVTNAAASTVTREKEDGTLDLLLTTPITSRYYIWGKLRGLVSFVLPLVSVPIFSVLVFVAVDFFRMLFVHHGPEFEWVVFPEAIFVMPGTLVIVVAFASILGMQMSLRFRTTVMAVMTSVGIVVGACFGLGFCGFNIVSKQSLEAAALVIGGFSPFTLLTVLINPWKYAHDIYSGDSVTGDRIAAFLAGWAAVGAYAGVVWAMYKSMVKNFDMTIRKQSR